MSIASRINEMTEHLRNGWDSIDKLGLDITEENSNDNLDKNIENIAPVLDRFYNKSSDKTDLSENGIVGRTSQNHTIPVEYTRVDYIESSGTQYIDTGVKANQDTITDVALEINQFTEDYNVYFGSRYQFSSQAYELMSVYRPGYGIDPSIANTYNNGYVYTDTISTNTKYNIRKEKNVAYLDGNIIANQEYAEFETPVNMYIFATNSNGNANYKSSIRLYKMTISDGTNMLRDFIPCYRNSDNAVGLYDLVNDVFYTNQGTGVFTYGNIILEPSPDYPLEINNLSGDVEYRVRGKNLFDKNNANVLNAYFAQEKVIASSSAGKTLYISCEPNTTYTVSRIVGTRFRLLTTETTPTLNVNGIDYQANDNATSLTITTSNNANYLCVYYYSSSSDTKTEQQILDSIMINEGSTPLPYEPHISESFPLSLKSRNLFDKDNANVLDGMFINASAGNIGSNANTTSIYIPINPNTTYCVSKTRGNRFAIGYSSTTPAVNVSLTNIVDDRTKTSLTSASASNSKYLVIYISLSDTETLQEILDSIMINEGSTVTSYEPYYDIELCNISDYKDRIYSQNGEFYLEKKNGKVVLNGSEIIGKISATGGNLFRFQDIAVSVANISPVSNYFIGVPNNSSRYDGTIYYNYNASPNRMVFDILTTKFTAVDEFKSWLSTHNTELQFPIPTPITTKITQENYPTLYSQLLAIQEFLTKYKINNEFLLDYSSPEIEY